jgi:hypothetical protein
VDVLIPSSKVVNSLQYLPVAKMKLLEREPIILNAII